MKYFYYYLFFITIILIFSYINSMQIGEKEEFTPSLKQMYRPYIRHGRVYGEKIYEQFITPFTNTLRRKGIL